MHPEVPTRARTSRTETRTMFKRRPATDLFTHFLWVLLMLCDFHSADTCAHMCCTSHPTFGNIVSNLRGCSNQTSSHRALDRGYAASNVMQSGTSLTCSSAQAAFRSLLTPPALGGTLAGSRPNAGWRCVDIVGPVLDSKSSGAAFDANPLGACTATNAVRDR